MRGITQATNTTINITIRTPTPGIQGITRHIREELVALEIQEIPERAGVFMC
jgi:hypothetical protein